MGVTFVTSTMEANARACLDTRVDNVLIVLRVFISTRTARIFTRSLGDVFSATQRVVRMDAQGLDRERATPAHMQMFRALV
mmetsp:Transcript_9882/g.29885  ORF Transcript_9882/g.29885 Transcript_9882/m.29885 type:complete len:81 (-) Transcript_9882:4936-5178(-)